MRPGQLVIEVGLFNGCSFPRLEPASDVPYVSDIAPTCIFSLRVGSGHGKFAQKHCVRINPDILDQRLQCFFLLTEEHFAQANAFQFTIFTFCSLFSRVACSLPDYLFTWVLSCTEIVARAALAQHRLL